MTDTASTVVRKSCLIKFVMIVVFFSVVICPPVKATAESLKKDSGKKIIITKKDLLRFGEEIFDKECDGDIDKLVAWNRGEAFASFGIGHFIWYPRGYQGPFDESFPTFLKFVKKRGVALPKWIEQDEEKGCPWKNRNDFYRNLDSYKMRTLKRFLIKTRYHQSLFIVQRFIKAFPKMMKAASYDKKQHIKQQFFRIADSSLKLYALIDYVNFKGEGIKKSERYNNVGWGLLQVLEEMKGTQKGSVALCDFARAAETVLTRRVMNSPVERNEIRWLNGWKNRVNYYRTLDQYL